jgi:hypothetical protein
MSSDTRFILTVIGLGAITVALVVSVVLLVIGQNNYYKDEQRKQDKCIAAGGAWIDNRHTDAYCFFNK